MSDPDRSFTDVRLELEDIVSQVRDKDTSLEKSLDLFEKAIRLGNDAFELIDRVEFSPEESAELAEGKAVPEHVEDAVSAAEGASDEGEEAGASEEVVKA